jgi:alpha-D-xyloside xylohydrolase
MDATEPENDALAGKQTYFGAGDFYRLTYPLFVSKAVYEGQRATNDRERVAILTRSAFAGQQRYGTINWSGDIGWDWDAYKRQIVAGLNYSITGMPYWTTDIGGFFRPGVGQYTDPKYHDILTRWFQWGAFNSIFRVHGYQTETEPWKYGNTVEADIRSTLNLRYRQLPYIYSEAWQFSGNHSTLMRPMIMDFKQDTAAVGQAYQYMFGKSFLVAPVVQPGVTSWNVYLPKSSEWYEFWTGKRFRGGQTVKADAPQDRIPLFVKAGSIVPMGKFLQFSGEKSRDTLELRIYAGADGQFTLYDDEGDNYNYEKGIFSEVKLGWDDSKKILTISDRKGSFPGMPEKCRFNVVLVRMGKAGTGNAVSRPDRTIDYEGKKLTVKF